MAKNIKVIVLLITLAFFCQGYIETVAADSLQAKRLENAAPTPVPGPKVTGSSDSKDYQKVISDYRELLERLKKQAEEKKNCSDRKKPGQTE